MLGFDMLKRGISKSCCVVILTVHSLHVSYNMKAATRSFTLLGYESFEPFFPLLGMIL